jgi:16S rRNA (guanine1516-N2)-methyltransferase
MQAGFKLERDEQGRLVLCDLQNIKQHPLVVDFASAGLNYRRTHGVGKNQTLGKALGLKAHPSPTVIDATAGMGVDAFIMASLGCRVRAFERSEVVFSLLQDGYRRLLEHEPTECKQNERELQAIAGRLSFECCDAVVVLSNLANEDRPDLIYLDPMFPEEGRAKTALPKKGMQTFRRLIGEENDTLELLKVALNCAKKRVVVKRPIHSPNLEIGRKPTHVFLGKSTRFDMYLCE